ncbi:MAG: hypothetical protein ACHQAZ_01710 [Gammaproteobacteria bacterium]
MSMGGTSAQPQSFWNVGDPANLFGHSSSSSLSSNILDPGDVLGLNPAASGVPQAPGVPKVLPNLGAASMMPRLPQGAFVAPSTGGGAFNSMAQALAGPLFNPSIPVKAAPQARTNLTPLLAYLQGAGMARGK